MKFDVCNALTLQDNNLFLTDNKVCKVDIAVVTSLLASAPVRSRRWFPALLPVSTPKMPLVKVPLIPPHSYNYQTRPIAGGTVDPALAATGARSQPRSVTGFDPSKGSGIGLGKSCHMSQTHC